MEDYAREEGLEGEELLLLRDALSRPLMDLLKGEIDSIASLGVLKGKLGKAVKYARGQWEAMCHYLEVAEAEIDNNWSENSMRPFVLGRKNFLFLGSEKGGGERATVFFSLVQSCRRLGVDPFAYLSDVIERISTHPQSRIEELTPRGWLEAREAAENATR